MALTLTHGWGLCSAAVPSVAAAIGAARTAATGRPPSEPARHRRAAAAAAEPAAASVVAVAAVAPPPLPTPERATAHAAAAAPPQHVAPSRLLVRVRRTARASVAAARPCGSHLLRSCGRAASGVGHQASAARAARRSCSPLAGLVRRTAPSRWARDPPLAEVVAHGPRGAVEQPRRARARSRARGDRTANTRPRRRGRCCRASRCIRSEAQVNKASYGCVPPQAARKSTDWRAPRSAEAPQGGAAGRPRRRKLSPVRVSPAALATEPEFGGSWAVVWASKSLLIHTTKTQEQCLDAARAARVSGRAAPSATARCFATTSRASPSRRSAAWPAVAASSASGPHLRGDARCAQGVPRERDPRRGHDTRSTRAGRR